MTLSDSVKSCLDKYASTQGRAPRSEYWWFMVFKWLVLFFVSVVFGVIGAIINSAEGAVITISVGYSLICFALIVPDISVAVRRLHDTGHSGFWYFIIFVPLVGAFWFLYLMIKDSDDENEYGLPVY